MTSMPNRGTRRWHRRYTVLAVGLATIPMIACQPGMTPPQFPGLYDVTRGNTQIKFSWVIGTVEGEFEQNTSSAELEPVDPNDFPELLQPLAENWNTGLEDLNANIDDVFPNQVLISHPQPWLIRVEDPNDPNEFFQGVNGQDGFLALAAGLGTGALGASSVQGVWDGVDTITGTWEVSITFGGSGPQGGLLMSIAIVIPYEAVLVAEE